MPPSSEGAFELPLTISSGDSSVSYTYDVYNRLTQIHHNGFTYNYAFDKFGNTSTVKVGDQTLVTNVYESGNGQLQSEIYGNGTVYSYSYDEYGRVTDVFIDGTKSYSTVYNAKGQIAEIIDLVNNAKSVYTYDISGRVIRVSQSGGKSISTGYDILNRVTAINYQFAGQTKTASYGYGKDGQKGTSTLLSGATQTTTYDSLSRETTSTVGSLTRNTSYFNVSGNKTTALPQTIAYTQNGNTLLSTAYTYDVRGNIATLTVDGVTYTYTYDSLNQLTGVTTSDNSFTASYSYDDGGNITSKTVNGVTTPYGYTDSNWKDKLTSYNGNAITYDGMGNPDVSYNKRFIWFGRQMGYVDNPEGMRTYYSYNSDGIRIKKAVNGVTTNYFLDGSTILAEQTGSNVIWYIYDSAGELLGFTYNNTPYYYLKNQQGDVYKVVDASGTIVANYTYDPWGKVLSATGEMAEINPIRYRSYYYDTETGFYYLQSRYYDPEIGRFINADDSSYLGADGTVTGYNLYSYCGNNPIFGYDPMGTLSWGKLFSGVKTLVTGVVAVATAATVIACSAAAPVMVAVAVVTAVAGTLTAVNGAAEIVESGTGYNVVRDGVFRGNEKAYNTYSNIVETTAEVGTMITGSYIAAKGGNVCFVAGTAVLTACGYVAIENIASGDMVYAWDEETGTVGIKEVVETYINETSELVHVFVGGEEIITTPSHPFYSPVKGWTDAVHLRAGDILVTVNGELVVVEKIQHEILESPITVYNFQVEGYHTYYVSNVDILVHNDCYKPIRDGDMRATINPGELEAPHAHIFQKNNNIGRIFSNGKLDESLINNRNAMKFVKKHYDEIIELIDKFYGKR